LPSQRLDQAFRLAYARPATAAEIREALAYLQETRKQLLAIQTPADRLDHQALASYLRVLLASNEFLYVD
jgi:hypothetical protein